MIAGRDSSRSSHGASSVELVFGLMLLIPVALILIDLGSIMISVFANDSLCREACRSAAAARPADAKKVALQLVERANAPGSKLAVYRLKADPGQTAMKVPPEEQGGLVEGNVTVQTAVDVQPMFLVGVFYGGKPIEFVAQQTFPYTYVMQPKPRATPANAGGADDEEEE